MRISTKGRYGTRAMIALAANYNQGLLSASKIAATQHLSLKYLENLLSTLKTARLVTSTRGQRGGYALARSPEEITLYDVLAPLEDALDIVHCTEEDNQCILNNLCCTQEVWKRIRGAVDDILCETTLASLVERQIELDLQLERQIDS